MQPDKPTKVYVEVKVTFTPEGQMRPRAIRWEDDKLFKIDRIKEIKQAAAMKCGGQGDRYTVYINGQETYLFFERTASLTGDNIGRWFVERRGE